MNDIFRLIMYIFGASSFMYQFFIDYNRKRYFIASIELIFSITFIASIVCILWYSMAAEMVL